MCPAVLTSDVAASSELSTCRRRVSARPKSAEARCNLAYALAASDDPAGAVEQSSAALALKPDFRRAARLLASLLQRYRLNAEIDISARGLEAAFAFIDADRQALGNAAIDYLKDHSPLTEALDRGRTAGWDEAARFLLGRAGRKLLRNRLLCAALTHSVNTDIDLEFLLTALRRRFLEARDCLDARPVYEFACVLIRQCQNNGYVFRASEHERSKAAALRFDLDAIFDGDTNDVAEFITAALYRPLHEVVGDAQCARGCDKVLPHALRPVVRDCLDACEEDRRCAEHMPLLSAITDETSLRVAAQYTADPYPQWLSMQAPEPGSAAARLSQHFLRGELDVISEPCNVLIAGAGTCEQAISSAIAYGPQADVLAVDLSASSLAYGARMARSFGAGNLRFAQGDILRLSELNQDFDVVECGGVLHHMEEPFEAWRILVDRLRPGGLMRIGLYSAVSRRNIAALDNDPDWPGPGADDDALRAFRRALMERRPDGPGFELTRSVDFFAKSGFRDLALHVHEQRCTIPEIGDFLRAKGLEFRGFTLPPATLAAYQDRFGEPAVPGRLDRWWAFEQSNPRTFDGMYTFWCYGPNP